MRLVLIFESNWFCEIVYNRTFSEICNKMLKYGEEKLIDIIVPEVCIGEVAKQVENETAHLKNISDHLKNLDIFKLETDLPNEAKKGELKIPGLINEIEDGINRIKDEYFKLIKSMEGRYKPWPIPQNVDKRVERLRDDYGLTFTFVDSLIAATVLDIIDNISGEKPTPILIYLEKDDAFRKPQGASFKEELEQKNVRYYHNPESCLEAIEMEIRKEYINILITLISNRIYR